MCIGTITIRKDRSDVGTKQKQSQFKGYLEKVQQEFNGEFNDRTTIDLDKLRSPQFPANEFEDLKKVLVMYSALTNVPSHNFMIEASTLEMAVAAANVPALNAAVELYRNSMEDLRTKVFRKHANKTSAARLTRKGKIRKMH